VTTREQALIEHREEELSLFHRDNNLPNFCGQMHVECGRCVVPFRRGTTN
jgi:hypothetical protein